MAATEPDLDLSLIGPFVQTKFPGDTRHRPGQTNSLSVGRATELAGDFGPPQTLFAAIQEPQLLSRHPSPRLINELARSKLPARRAIGCGTIADVRTWVDPPLVATGGMLTVRLVRNLVARDRHQQPDKLIRILQIVLAQRHTDEERSEDRLANINRFHKSAQPRVAQPNPYRTADRRFITLDQSHGSPFIPGANPLHEFVERRFFTPQCSGRALGAVWPHDHVSWPRLSERIVASHSLIKSILHVPQAGGVLFFSLLSETWFSRRFDLRSICRTS